MPLVRGCVAAALLLLANPATWILCLMAVGSVGAALGIKHELMPVN